MIWDKIGIKYLIFRFVDSKNLDINFSYYCYYKKDKIFGWDFLI